MNHIVVMAGGRGTRFWPKSRQQYPKHLIPFLNGKSLLQLTVERIKKSFPIRNIWIVTSKDHVALTRKQLPKAFHQHILIEPQGKNTAACIGLAAVHIADQDPLGVFAAIPADHYIQQAPAYLRSLKIAFQLAEASRTVVTMGVKPTYPATGYGYIQKGKQIGSGGLKAFRVKRFVEKPNQKIANRYLNSRSYLWNSGVFVWPVLKYLHDIKDHMPKLFAGLVVIANAVGKKDEDKITRQVYRQFKSISVDYGVMEKLKEVLVMRLDCGWSDVGSWESVFELLKKDQSGNAVVGKAMLLQSQSSLVWSTESRLIATLGIGRLVIVDTPKALLVCDMKHAQEVRKLVTQLEKQKRFDLI